MVFDSCTIYSNKQIMITMFSTYFFFPQWKNLWRELLNGELPFALVCRQCSRATWRSSKMHYQTLSLLLNP